MKTKELKNKKSDELLNLLIDSRKKLSELKLNLASGKVKNVKAIKMLKKDIARILTILDEPKIMS